MKTSILNISNLSGGATFAAPPFDRPLRKLPEEKILGKSTKGRWPSLKDRRL
jgi:hypothetical protein